MIPWGRDQIILYICIIDYRIRSLRSLTLSKISESNLSPDDFQGFGTDLEELKISDGADRNIKGLKNHAFRDVRGLKKLDLSENSISNIEHDAFAEVRTQKKMEGEGTFYKITLKLNFFLTTDWAFTVAFEFGIWFVFFIHKTTS